MMRLKKIAGFSVVFSGLLGAANAQQRDRLESFEMVSPMPIFMDYAGSRVATAGKWVFVNAPISSLGTLNGGAILSYERTESGVIEHPPLTPPDLVQSEAMSRWGMAASGDTLAVVSRSYPNGQMPTGRVNVFELNAQGTNWTFSESIEPSLGHTPGNEFYGSSLALHSDLMFVGAPGLGALMSNGQQSQRGGFYFYERVSGVWTERQVWQAPSSVDIFEGIGTSMTTDGETLIARGGGAFDAYILERNVTSGDWEIVQEIADPAGIVIDDDGLAVDVEGDLMAFGGEANNYIAPGRVFLYERLGGTWVQGQVLVASDSGGFGDSFGKSVDIYEGRIVVGASGAADANFQFRHGAAYVFEKDSQGVWQEVYKLTKSNPMADDRLGVSVALGPGYAVVGDNFHTAQANQTEGGAFGFNLPMGSIGCVGVDNSTGVGAQLEVLGSPIAEEGFVRLRAYGLLPGLAGVFLGARNSAFVQNPAGSKGNLCLGGAVARFNQGGQFGLPMPDGSFELQIDASDVPFAPGIPIVSGQTWHFQMWYRDLDPTPTTNLTSSVEVTFR